MRESYDVVILGCGEAGIFAAYELEKRNHGVKLLAIDQGPDIYHRSCPIVTGKVRECGRSRLQRGLSICVQPYRKRGGKQHEKFRRRSSLL